jgi:hypothetical protein
MVAATLMPFFIIMCELFNGILQPHKNMPVFWKYTMYYVTPFTYWIGGVLTSVLRGMPVVCSQDELVVFESPLNMTCGEYAMPWLSSTGSGYLSNPDGRGHCGYCKYSRGDDVSLNFCWECTERLLTPPVSLGDRSRRVQNLALFWYIHGLCHLKLPHGLCTGLCALGYEVLVALTAEGIHCLL